MEDKFKVSVIDALEYHGKINSGHVDKDSTPLFVGDTILKNDRKYLIGYRYGKFVLLPMVSSIYMDITDTDHIVKTNEVTASTHQWLIIGYVSEPFFEELKAIMA